MHTRKINLDLHMLLAEVRVFISHECHCSPRKSSSDVKLPCDFTNAGVHFSQSPFRGRGGASNVRALCRGVGRVGRVGGGAPFQLPHLAGTEAPSRTPWRAVEP